MGISSGMHCEFDRDWSKCIGLIPCDFDKNEVVGTLRSVSECVKIIFCAGFCAVVKDITLRWHQTALHLTLRPLLLLLKNRREFLEKRKVPHRPKFWREHMLVRSMNVAEGLFHQRKAIFAFNHSLICLFNSCNTTVANTCVIGKPILLIQLTCMMRAYLWKCANSSEL